VLYTSPHHLLGTAVEVTKCEYYCSNRTGPCFQTSASPRGTIATAYDARDSGSGAESGYVQLEYLNVTVLRRGVGELRVVAGRAPAC
jgi:hypothetical protein